MNQSMSETGLQGRGENAHLVRAQVASLAHDGAREGLFEGILVRIRLGAHARDERLARERAVGQVVPSVVRREYAFLIDSIGRREAGSVHMGMKLQREAGRPLQNGQ